jgi:hypothetical protein
MKDYDTALVAAFRREQEKEAKLKAAIAAKQIAEQLVCSSLNYTVFCVDSRTLSHEGENMCQYSTPHYSFINFNFLLHHRRLKDQKR